MYQWQGADAVWSPAGATVDVPEPYVVPDETLCDGCHSTSFNASPIGPTALQLVQADQVATLFAAGVFSALPDTSAVVPLVDPADTTASIDRRARSWLHANCAHCHSASGTARISNLYLTVDEADPTRLGTCKTPNQGDGGTGLAFDVVPGHPEQSFLLARIASTDPAVKMPVAPNLRADPLGIDLVTQWIAGMQESTCNPP